MIKAMDYCRVVSDKQLKQVGLHNGDLVLVTGTKVAPIKKDDPYLQRIYVTVIKVDKDGTHYLPDETNDNYIYLVDPRNLEVVSEDIQKDMEDALVTQYEGRST